MEKKKISTTSLVFWIVVLVVLFVDIFLLPKSGNLVLLDETFDNLIIIIFLGYIIYKVAKVIKKNNGIKRVILILIIVICSGIIIISKDRKAANTRDITVIIFTIFETRSYLPAPRFCPIIDEPAALRD